jgi:hypothetical protein
MLNRWPKSLALVMTQAEVARVLNVKQNDVAHPRQCWPVAVSTRQRHRP